MTRSEFYATLDDILELPIGTVKGDEKLKELPNWDSLAVVSYIATCHGLFKVVLSGDRVKATTSVQELMSLVGPHITD